jgi:hypothetical protein
MLVARPISVGGSFERSHGAVRTTSTDPDKCRDESQGHLFKVLPKASDKLSTRQAVGPRLL